MTRRLRAEEEELWARVVQSVSPIHPQTPGQTAAAQAAPTPLPRPVSLRRDSGPRRATPPIAAPARPAAAAHAESLDAAWDKRLSSGRLQPDVVIDLHGLRREQARHLLYQRVLNAEAHGARVILVITGKGHMPGPSPADLMEGRATRGAIRADLPRWLGEPGLTDRIAAVRRAHPRHGGAGAAYLILKRRRGSGSA
jgi:DNA-nicking Smr family endonuclease